SSPSLSDLAASRRLSAPRAFSKRMRLWRIAEESVMGKNLSEENETAKRDSEGWSRFERAVDAAVKSGLSTTETKCAKRRRESVPARLTEKGFEAPFYNGAFVSI
ncbi:MAG TPA: hypothetical protein VNR65_04050, partial [Geobacterales bacterium]|nr:hypothetical protein [Geobacterales bacterium]